MKIWALADLHLAFGAPEKDMAAFGAVWAGYAEKIAKNWRACVAVDDLVLLPGDTSWAMRPEQAKLDLEWIDALPGTKLLLRGNHDYWWPSAAKLRQLLPPSLHFIHNNAFSWHGVALGGARLWDSAEYTFGAYVDYQPNMRENVETHATSPAEKERIFVRELQRLRLSLDQMDRSASVKIAMTHYPPIGADLQPSRASQILEEFGIQICVFGHLHGLRRDVVPTLFGQARGVRYVLTACDAVDFTPSCISGPFP